MFGGHGWPTSVHNVYVDGQVTLHLLTSSTHYKNKDHSFLITGQMKTYFM